MATVMRTSVSSCQCSILMTHTLHAIALPMTHSVIDLQAAAVHSTVSTIANKLMPALPLTDHPWAIP